MITLNLIPPIKKREIRLTQIYILIKNLIVLLLFLAIVVAITLLLTKMFLQNYFNNIVEQTTLTTRHTNIFNKDFKEFNERLKVIKEIQKEHAYWTGFFVKFSKLAPAGLILDNLIINKNKILITGTAKMRDQLLVLKTELENSELFANVEIPLENLLKKEEVNFNIKADINLDKF